MFIYLYLYVYSTYYIYNTLYIRLPFPAQHPIPFPPKKKLLVEGLAVTNLTGQVRGQKDQHGGHIHRLSTAVVVHAGAPDLKAVRQQDETHQKDHLTLSEPGHWEVVGKMEMDPSFSMIVLQKALPTSSL